MIRIVQQKETLIITYKALIKPILTYAAPIWFPNASLSSIAIAQTIQNSALRIATGSHRMASVSHLHSEAEVLPVSNHLSLLCSQFLCSALRPSHPSHQTVIQASGPRTMKRTLQSRFLPSVAHLLEDRVLPPGTYRQALRTLHTSAVSSYIRAASHSKVLLAPLRPLHLGKTAAQSSQVYPVPAEVGVLLLTPKLSGAHRGSPNIRLPGVLCRGTHN